MNRSRIFLLQVDPKYVRNLKFTKHHNHVARKNLRKARKVKLAGGDASAAGKVVKRPVRQPQPTQKSSWSLSSLLKNVTSYFTGETAAPAKKRAVRKHTSKKSKTHAATTKTTTTTAKPTTVAAKK